MGALVGVAAPGGAVPLLRGVPPGAALPAAARRRGVRRRRPRRARLAAPDRVHPVGQRRRVVPHGARRGHGVPCRAGCSALARRGDDLRHPLDQGKPGGDGRVDRRPVVAGGVGGRPAGRAPGRARVGSRHRRRDLAAAHPRRAPRRRRGPGVPAARLGRLTPVFFTLAVSAATSEGCTALTERALAVDPAVMPVTGPASVAGRSADGPAALLHWGDGSACASHAGTIWAGTPAPDGNRDSVYARTSVTRVDPVYLTEIPGGVIVADRATRAAWTSSRLDGHAPLHLCALLNPGYPLGSVTPFHGVTAVAGSVSLRLRYGSAARGPARPRARGGPRHRGP